MHYGVYGCRVYLESVKIYTVGLVIGKFSMKFGKVLSNKMRKWSVPILAPDPVTKIDSHDQF